MTQPLIGTGVWSSALRNGDPSEIGAAAGELESLGYGALWIPDVGGDVFAAVENLLAATTTATIATGILNLWMHTAEETAANHATLTTAPLSTACSRWPQPDLRYCALVNGRLERIGRAVPLDSRPLLPTSYTKAAARFTLPTHC